MLRWRCPTCGLLHRADDILLPLHCCGRDEYDPTLFDDGTPPPPPPLVTRAARYVSAFTRWILAGRPTRDDAAVDQLFAAHCGPCPLFTGELCRVCGCAVGDVSRESASRVANKLRWATEHCPLGKW